MQSRAQDRFPLYAAGAITILVIAGGLWFGRGTLRDAFADATKPSVPEAVPYKPTTSTMPVVTSTPPVVKPSTATSTPPVTATNPKPEPTPTTGNASSWAKEVNLAVPFLLQAPKQDWSAPFEDACEEASLLMVNGYYKDRGHGWTPDEGEKDILALIAYEDKTYGYDKDTTSNDVAHTAMGYFGFPKAQVVDATESNIKDMLNKGYPLIVPADGKLLLNPNFKNGGPEYHMLVIKGYKADGSWITNDPGTRNGPDYVYPHDRLLNAIHDFKAGDMAHGDKVMVVVFPQ